MPFSRSRLLSGLPALVATALLAACAGPGPGPGPSPGAGAAPPALEARVAALLAGMTLEQKVGQMTQAEIQHATPDDVRRYHLGSVLNGGGSWPGKRADATPADWLALAEAYHLASLSTDGPVKVPVIWGTDAVHGHNNVRGATLFPHHIGLGAANDPALMEAIGRATARAVRATGIAWTFAPTLAVARDDRWGRSYESLSEDPARVGRLGGAEVRGLQAGLGSERGVVATAKHFLGDGGTNDGQDQGVLHATPEQLMALHGAGYTAALAEGVQTVMVSLHSWVDTASGQPQGKMHGNRPLLTGLLKEKLGFDGVVVTDWNGIGQLPGCTASSCAAAINAGIDMVMVPQEWKAFIAHTVAQVKAGQIPRARIDDAVRRILRVKLRAGLFDRRPSQAAQAGELAALRDAETRALARRAVRQSLVLLKNNGQLLPLERSTRVRVVGKSADDVALQSGGWSLSWQGLGHSNADFPGATTVLAGVRAQAAQVQYSATAEGVDPASFDVVLAVVGESPYAEFNGDIGASGTLRHSSRYPEDLTVLRRAAAWGKPVVTVLLSGRVVHANDLLNRSQAFVAAWLPGTEGGGVADLLFRGADGRVQHDFTGRLSFSWPRSACQVPLNAGDANYAPLFALGYGLGVNDRATVPALDETLPRGGCGGAEEVAILRQSVQRPFSLHLRGLGDKPWRGPDPSADPLAVTEAPARHLANPPAVRVSTVEMHTQQDAKRVTWLGAARLYAWASARTELSNYPDAALVFDTVVTRAPTAPVVLAMECGHGCGAALDVTALFAKAGAAPRTLKVPVACFAARGLDSGRVDVPFSIATTAPFEAAFARIRITAGAARDADALRCSDLPAAPPTASAP